MNDLARIDKATQMLAEAETIEDVVAIRDMATAAAAYARAAQMGREAITHAMRIKVRAERKAGELLAVLERQKPGPKKISPHAADNSEYRKAIDASKVSERDARRWQQLAKAPEAKFEKVLGDIDGNISTRSILNALKPKPKPKPPPKKPRRMTKMEKLAWTIQDGILSMSDLLVKSDNKTFAIPPAKIASMTRKEFTQEGIEAAESTARWIAEYAAAMKEEE